MPATPASRRLLGVLLLAAAILVLHGSQAARAAAKPCAKGAVRVQATGPAACVALVRLRAAAAGPRGDAARRRAVADPAGPRLARRVLGVAPALTTTARQRTALRRLRLHGAAVARAAQAGSAAAGRRLQDAAPSRETIAGEGPDLPGYDTRTVSQTPTAAEGEQVGGGDVTASAVQQTPQGTVELWTRIVDQHRLDECPSAAGIVRGEVRWGQGEERRLDGAGVGAARRGHSSITTADVTVHVGDDAQVVSYDLDAVLVFQVTASTRVGGVTRHVPTRTFRSRLVLRGLKPGVDIADQFGTSLAAEGGTWGPQGRLDGFNPVLEQLIGTLVMMQDRVMTAIERSRRVWDDGAGCLTAVFTPGGRGAGSLELDEGAAQPVGVAVEARDGAGVALELGLTAEGVTVAPAAGTAPVAAEVRGPKATKAGVVRAEGVSRRGRVRGRLAIVVRARPPGPKYFKLLLAKGSITSANVVRTDGSCTFTGPSQTVSWTDEHGTPAVLDPLVPEQTASGLQYTGQLRVPIEAVTAPYTITHQCDGFPPDVCAMPASSLPAEMSLKIRYTAGAATADADWNVPPAQLGDEVRCTPEAPIDLADRFTAFTDRSSLIPAVQLESTKPFAVLLERTVVYEVVEGQTRHTGTVTFDLELVLQPVTREGAPLG